MATKTRIIIIALIAVLALSGLKFSFAQNDGGSCVAKYCSELKDIGSCNGAPGCGWVEALGTGSCKGTAIGDCAPHNTREACGGFAACIWSTDACTTTDGDKDGYYKSLSPNAQCSSPVDCNDYNADANPAQAEACDNVDNNCNGQKDEGVTQLLYTDADGDSFGDPATGRQQCPGDKLVTNNQDCDDTNNAVFPGAAEACDGLDNNCDSFKDNAQGIQKDGTLPVPAPRNAQPSGSPCGKDACTGVTTWLCANGQPNDPDLQCSSNGKDAGVCALCDSQGNAEFASQPADCAPVACPEQDRCELRAGIVAYVNYTDFVPNVCQNIGKCSTSASTFNLTQACSFVSNVVTTDIDHDGWTDVCGDCNESNSATHVNATEICDKQDNNCDTKTDETFDTDNDGFFNATCTGVYPASRIDTDDKNANVYLGALELCDGVDNDGDSAIDNINNSTNITITKCACSGKTAAQITSIKAKTEANNKIDDNCDGLLATAEEDFDADGVAIYESDCNDHDADINPGALEICIGSADDNCNGQVNEGCATDSKTDSLVKTTLGAQNSSSDESPLPVIGSASPSLRTNLSGAGSTAGLRGTGIESVSVEEKKSSAKLIAAIIVAILGAAGGGFYFMRLRAKASLDLEAEGFGVAEPEQAGKQDVKDFVSSSAAQGYSATDIKNTLKEKGWDEGDVDRAVEETASDLESLGKISEKRGLASKDESAISGYIKETRSKGFSNEQIRAALVSEGWKKDVVDTYFEKPKPRPKPRSRKK
ncbi:MAG: RecX family transcriptional regulator [DPANN group archaeon]|nr:RecX family transcriptional regulator [DPANN group archaeon]